MVGIGLARGYTGTIDGRIRIGSTLEEASRVLGAVDTSSRAFRVAGRSGIGFDGAAPPPGQPPDPDGRCALPLAMIERIVGGQHIAEAGRLRDAWPALHQTRPAIKASWYNHGHLGGRVR